MKLLFRTSDNLHREKLMRDPASANMAFQRLCVQVKDIDWNVLPVVQITAWLQLAFIHIYELTRQADIS